MSDLGNLIAPGTGLVVILGGAIAVVRWARPRWRRFTSKVEQLFESVNGRPAIVDKATGRVIDPPVPSLGIRLESLEGAVRDRAELDGRVTAVETLVGVLGGRVSALERATGRAMEAIASQPVDPAGD